MEKSQYPFLIGTNPNHAPYRVIRAAQQGFRAIYLLLSLPWLVLLGYLTNITWFLTDRVSFSRRQLRGQTEHAENEGTKKVLAIGAISASGRVIVHDLAGRGRMRHLVARDPL